MLKNNAQYQNFDQQMIQMYTSREAQLAESVFDLAALFEYFEQLPNKNDYINRFEAICKEMPIISSEELLHQNQISGELQNQILKQVNVDNGILMYLKRNIENDHAIPLTDYQIGQLYQDVITENRKDA